MANHGTDIMVLLVHVRDFDHAAGYLNRFHHDRPLPDGSKLWAQLKQNVVAGAYPVQPARGWGRKRHMVRERICASSMELRHDKKDTLPVTCLPAEGVDATEGSKPMVCRLLSNHPVQSLDDALELID